MLIARRTLPYVVTVVNTLPARRMTIVTVMAGVIWRLDSCYRCRYIPGMATAGKTLKRERTRALISATALAARMGISRQTLWIIEQAAEVDAARVVAYREALHDAKQTPQEGTAA